MARHDILGGKVQIYRRDETRHWQCSASINGRQLRVTTKHESLELAKDFAEDWYLELRGKLKRGELNSGKTFKEAADRFLHEYNVITRGQRSPRMIEQYKSKIDLYLNPFFGKKWLSEITPALVQDYRIERHEKMKGRGDKAPSVSTMHKDIVTLRQILKGAVRNGWLDRMPDLSEPYRKSPKVSHRAWFSPEEYEQLYTATRKRAKRPPKKSFKWQNEQLHDYVLFMVNTGLRPDEARRLEFRDVKIVDDEATRETILEITVRGKRGTGYCKSTPNAVRYFKRIRDRLRPANIGLVEGEKSAVKNGRSAHMGGPSAKGESPIMVKTQPTDRLFPTPVSRIFRRVLNDKDLKLLVDREGNPRSPYSLRHTYICFRLTEGADIYQLAKNCRTSVEMIEKYYASHIASSLDAAAINVFKKAIRKEVQEEAKS
ncbi:MAG TPA: site-specific integrase [Magnetospirillaceae bacterium]|jgi:integrase